MKCNEKNYSILIIVILLIMLILNLFSFFKKDGALNLETIKVGGVENMEAVKKLYESEWYIAQQTIAIDQALSQIETIVEPNLEDIVEWETTDEGNDIEEDIIEEIEEVVVNDDMVASIKKVKESALLHGDKDARFTILEYSELLCPYCKRQSDQGTIDDVIKKYPKEVNASFRNFIVHAPAAKLGEAIECVAELKPKKHHDFIKEAFAHDGTLNVDVLIEVADDLWIDEDDMQECLDNGKYTETVSNQTAEGRNLFGVSGTPGNVIVDGETGRFVLIPGAYPAEKLIEEIEKMKNSD